MPNAQYLSNMVPSCTLLLFSMAKDAQDNLLIHAMKSVHVSREHTLMKPACRWLYSVLKRAVPWHGITQGSPTWICGMPSCHVLHLYGS